MKKIATLMLTAALVAGGTVAATAKPYNERYDRGGTIYRNTQGYNGYNGYHRGYRHHGYYRGYRGHYYGYDDDGGDAWAGVLPGVVFGTILGSALSR